LSAGFGGCDHEAPTPTFERTKGMSKLRTPTKADMENAERWLGDAQYNLKRNEYHRVKQLCRQIIRALRRKETETPNVELTGAARHERKTKP
jgi:hypothetical protein